MTKLEFQMRQNRKNCLADNENERSNDQEHPIQAKWLTVSINVQVKLKN